MDIVLIPAYEPDEQLIPLVQELTENGLSVLVVDDGSGNRQLALLQKDGKPIMEPVPLNLRDVVYPPDETGCVIAGYTADGVVSYRHYDYAGNVSLYTDVTAKVHVLVCN